MVTLLLPGMALVHCVPSDIASGLFGAEKHCEMLLGEKNWATALLIQPHFFGKWIKTEF